MGKMRGTGVLFETHGEDDQTAGVAFLVDSGGEVPLVGEVEGGGGEFATAEGVVLADIQADGVEAFDELLEGGVATGFRGTLAELIEEKLVSLHGGGVLVLKVAGGGAAGEEGDDLVLLEGRIGAEGKLRAGEGTVDEDVDEIRLGGGRAADVEDGVEGVVGTEDDGAGLDLERAEREGGLGFVDLNAAGRAEIAEVAGDLGVDGDRAIGAAAERKWDYKLSPQSGNSRKPF